MVVFIVSNVSNGAGVIEGVFSSNDKAAEYMAMNPYSAFVVSECTVDVHVVKQQKVKADAT